MIVPILYGNESFNDLMRIRRTCGIRLLGLCAYRDWFGVDNDEYNEVREKIDKLQDVIFTVCLKLARGNEEKGLHNYLVYMKWLDKKSDAIDDIVNG